DAALERRAIHFDQYLSERAQVAREVRAHALADRGARLDAGERRFESRAAERLPREGEMERADGSFHGFDAQHRLLLRKARWQRRRTPARDAIAPLARARREASARGPGKGRGPPRGTRRARRGPAGRSPAPS